MKAEEGRLTCPELPSGRREGPPPRSLPGDGLARDSRGLQSWAGPPAVERFPKEALK